MMNKNPEVEERNNIWFTGGGKQTSYDEDDVFHNNYDFAQKNTQMESTPLEKAESVDMLRILEHGMKVKMVPTNYISYAVDTPKDLDRVKELIND